MVLRIDLWWSFVFLAGAFLLGILVFGVISRRLAKEPSVLPESRNNTLYVAVSHLSHQLKNMGQIIKGQIIGFSDRLPSDEDRWKVAQRAIREESDSIDVLTKRLDLIVRMGMPGQLLVMEPVNVARLLEDLFVKLAPAADEKGIELGGVGRGEGRENPHISADKVVLTEIFANLLDNALKHNQATTTITSEVAHKGGKLIVTISDNGSGIPREILDSIFAESNQKYVPGQNLGTGVGMYLSKLLTELHDGELTVQSTPEDGTKFTITLPVRRSN